MPPMLDGPPGLAPETTSQQGPPEMPFAGVGKMMLDQQGGGDKTPTAANPIGGLMTKANAVKKVLEAMVQEARAGKAFFSRAIELIDKALEAEGKTGGGAQSSSGSDLRPPSARPPESGAQSPAFPG